MAQTNWTLWFVQLSGWPVFLFLVAATVLSAIALSLAMTWLGDRPVHHAALMAMLAMAAIMFGLLAAISVVTALLF